MCHSGTMSGYDWLDGCVFAGREGARGPGVSRARWAALIMCDPNGGAGRLPGGTRSGGWDLSAGTQPGTVPVVLHVPNTLSITRTDYCTGTVLVVSGTVRTYTVHV